MLWSIARMPRRRWEPAQITAELRQLHRHGDDLSYNSLVRQKPGLLAAAVYHFGSYRRAIEKSGMDYADVQRRPQWTKQKIIREIKAARRNGEDLHWSAVIRRKDQLARAAFAALQPRLFGRWDKALQAAGIDADDVAIYREWSREIVLFELRGLAREREPMSSSEVLKLDAGLHAAAVRYFGSYENALRAAKIDPGPHRQRRRWTKELVLSELRSFARSQGKSHRRSIRSQAPALYAAAVRAFGSLSAAMKSAVAR